MQRRRAVKLACYLDTSALFLIFRVFKITNEVVDVVEVLLIGVVEVLLIGVVEEALIASDVETVDVKVTVVVSKFD
jgi:hypothetical protein